MRESPYLSVRRAVQPAIVAHHLLARDAERAGRLADECDELLRLTADLVRAAGRARLLGEEPGDPVVADGHHGVSDPGAERHSALLDAYADAAMSWAKVIGVVKALGETLLCEGAWDDVRTLAGALDRAGEAAAAADLRNQLAKAVWQRHEDQLGRINSAMPPEDIAASIAALRSILRQIPEDDLPGRNREVNRLLAPLAAAVHTMMTERGIPVPLSSRVAHIAHGGVAAYPDIVATSLDELTAEFEGCCGRRAEEDRT